MVISNSDKQLLCVFLNLNELYTQSWAGVDFVSSYLKICAT